MRTYRALVVFSFAAALTITLAFSSRAWSAPPSFQGLGDLPGGDFYSSAEGVSADGSVVVGFSQFASAFGGWAAFRWTRAEGMQRLGDLAGEGPIDVSADGSTIVGVSSSANGIEAVRWTSAGGMQRLGDLPGGAFDSRATAVSADGLVVVGWGNSASGTEAFRWTNSEGMEGLGFLGQHPSGNIYSYAHGVSADGSVVIGQSTSPSVPSFEAFRWTSAGGMQPLAGPRGENDWSYATAVSADGSTIVGGRSNEYFRWTSAAGIEGLGTYFPFGDWGSGNASVSGDGSIVVGWTIGRDDDGHAFIWDDIHGARDLQEVLVSDYGLDLTGWKLGAATGISADGRTIVGSGTNPMGQTEAWIATIPEPSSLMLLGACSAFLVLLRRRRVTRQPSSDQVI